MKKIATEKQLLDNLNNYEFYKNYIISKKLITKHKDKVDWSYISIYQTLSEKFITKYKDSVDWFYISIYQKLSEQFITKHKDKANWIFISTYQKLSEKFITKHKDKVDWHFISISQKLSEKFITKHKDKVSWYYISQYQVLSEIFIEKHKEKIDWDFISKYQVLSEQFIKKHNLTITETRWLYKDKQFKLDYLKKHTNYRIINKEYILAYKTVKSNNCSVFAPNKYKYEIGKTYESNCDCNVNQENSFGLAAWTKGKALEYYTEGKLLLVKIMIDDIGVIVQDNQKIRCKKLTVMEEL